MPVQAQLHPHGFAADVRFSNRLLPAAGACYMHDEQMTSSKIIKH